MTKDILGPLFSVVAWPPRVMHTWIRQLQKELNVCNFGPPHINLRAPFSTELSTEELVISLRQTLCDKQQFLIRVQDWKCIDQHVFFLECEFDVYFQQMHQAMLDIGPSSHASYDGIHFKPHLTLALGVLPWATEALWETVQDLEPPLTEFMVSSLSLTREERGEIQEIHTFPLLDAAAGVELPTILGK